MRNFKASESGTWRLVLLATFACVAMLLSRGLAPQRAYAAPLAPVITSTIPAGATGTACANCTIDVYSATNNTLPAIFTLDAEVISDAAGNWTTGVPMGGPYVTATATDSTGTSPYAFPVASPCTVATCIAGEYESTYQTLASNVNHCTSRAYQTGDGTAPSAITGPIDCTTDHGGSASAQIVSVTTTINIVGTVTFTNPVFSAHVSGSYALDGSSGSGTWGCLPSPCAGEPLAGWPWTATRVLPVSAARISAATGGTIADTLGDSLTIPPGSLAADTNIQIEMMPIPSSEPPPAGVHVLSRAFRATPSGTTFSPSATATLQYTAADIAGGLDPAALKVMVWDNTQSKWIYVGGTVNTVAMTITFSVPHFTDYAVFASTCTVTNTNDSGAGSLRAAIACANLVPGSTINFNIPGAGVHTITPLTPLPAITATGTTIDGTTQPGYAIGSKTIQLSGAALTSCPFVVNVLLALNGTGIVVQGLAINQFASCSSSAGIYIGGGGGNTARQNFLGTDATGTVAMPNRYGVVVDDSANNTIGGTSPGDGNVLSGNTYHGVLISTEFSDSTNNVVEGNMIGTDVTGAAALPNGSNGVAVYPDWQSQGAPGDVRGNIIGGTVPGARNVISGNTANGVSVMNFGPLAGFPGNNVVEGNYIGTAASGASALANGGDGVLVIGPGNQVGVTMGYTLQACTGGCNLISGNTKNGIELAGSSATGNYLMNNFIGVRLAGDAAVPNTVDGVLLDGGASANQIGGQFGSAQANLISGNGAWGVHLTDAGTNGNYVTGNRVGANATGSSAVPNSSGGVSIWNGAQGNAIGLGAGGGNLIAWNPRGVQIMGTTTTGNLVSRNGIHDNGALGIDLNGDGVTPNTPGGPHVGPNDFQNYPVLSSAMLSGGSVTISGALNSAPSTQFIIEFFANPTCDPSGYGQGQTYIGNVTVTTDGAGNVSFSPTTVASVSAGNWITATAWRTSPPLDTSEFSACVTVTSAGTPADPDANGDTDWSNPGAGLPCAQDHGEDANHDGYSDSDELTPSGAQSCTGLFPSGGGLAHANVNGICAGRLYAANGGTAAQDLAARKAHADVNLNGKVDLADLIIQAGKYNQLVTGPTDMRADLDLNGNGKVDLADLIIAAGLYNQIVPAC